MLGAGNPGGVLITSDLPLKESKAIHELLKVLFVPSIQLFYVRSSEPDGAANRGQPVRAMGVAGERAFDSNSTKAGITGGKITVINTTATEGIPSHVTVEKIPWDPSFGASTIRIKIPGTGYAIPLVGGKVTPVIIAEHPLEVWRIDGMRFTASDHDPKKREAGGLITNSNRIEPADGKLELILTGGEIYETWTLDFTDPKKGPQIWYRNGSGW